MRESTIALPRTAIAAMVEAMRRGQPWRKALDAVAVASGLEEALESMANEACGNWLWLTSFVRRDAALDVGGVISSMAPALSRHFRVVHHVEPSALLAEFAARRFAQDGLRNLVVSRGSAAALPFRDEAFDCVTLHGVIPRLAHVVGASTRDVLSECRRVLRPGGRAYVAFDNPIWYGRLTDPATWRAGEGAIGPAARAAGFRELDRFYAFPSFLRPRALVPATRRACYVRETAEASGTVRRAARCVTALVGLHAVLAPSVVMVAGK